MRKELILCRDPKSPVSEVFRTLRTNIQFMDGRKESNTILVTSTMPSEGKSWISSNLAVTFSQAGKKVLLVDSDMRKGRQYVIFSISPKPGLCNYLAGVNVEEDEEKKVGNIKNYIQETKIPGLDVLVGGNIPPNPSELLNSAQMVDLIEKLKKIYDVVIIDGTPCNLVTDSLILARLVDTTIIVAAHKKTKKKDLEKIIAGVRQVGGKVGGVVLNKVAVSQKRYQETYYYHTSTNKKKKTKRTKILDNLK